MARKWRISTSSNATAKEHNWIVILCHLDMDVQLSDDRYSPRNGALLCESARDKVSVESPPRLADVGDRPLGRRSAVR
jgi:hypothetical protein